MSVTEPHLGCAYQTSKGDAVCRSIGSGVMTLLLTMSTIVEQEKAGKGDPLQYQPFTVQLDDPNLRETYCMLEMSRVTT